MSCSSGQSIVDDGSRGFPSKCHCGLDVVIYTSNTKKNPGRPFFRCQSKREDHLFKWVEDGVYEEVLDVLPKLSVIDTEIKNAKTEVTIEIEELKARIKKLEEDEISSKREIRKWKWIIVLCLVCLCVTVIAMVISLFGKTKNQKLVLGYKSFTSL